MSLVSGCSVGRVWNYCRPLRIVASGKSVTSPTTGIGRKCGRSRTNGWILTDSLAAQPLHSVRPELSMNRNFKNARARRKQVSNPLTEFVVVQTAAAFLFSAPWMRLNSLKLTAVRRRKRLAKNPKICLFRTENSSGVSFGRCDPFIASR